MRNPSESRITEIDLKRYLYSELSEEEREAVETRLLLDDELFYQVADLENELVDKFARNQLPEQENERFKKALGVVPDRRVKLANALALKGFIDQEGPPLPSTVTIAERTVWQRIMGFFALSSPAFSFGVASLIVALSFLTVFLVIDNRKRSTEIARSENEQAQTQEPNTLSEQEPNTLQEKEQQENGLQEQIGASGDPSGRLNEKSMLATDRPGSRESEIDRKRRRSSDNRLDERRTTLATVFLSPMIISRGSDRSLEKLAIGSGTKRVALQLKLPYTIDASSDRLDVAINSKNVVRRASLLIDKSGQKMLRLTIRSSDLRQGTNSATVFDGAGGKVADYEFDVKKE